MTVQRFDCVTRTYEDSDYGEMEPDADGSYVSFEDYRKLMESHALLLAELRRINTIPVVRHRQGARLAPVIAAAEALA
jgi:hypothetical protein